MKRKREKAGRWLHRLVFALATLAIAGVLYEGWSLAWYAPVGVLIGAMDGSFLLATVWDFITYRLDRPLLAPRLISAVLLVVAIGQKCAGIDFAAIQMVVWALYIWLLHGYLVFVRRV